jgi:hypothetical protein
MIQCAPTPGRAKSLRKDINFTASPTFRTKSDDYSFLRRLKGYAFQPAQMRLVDSDAHGKAKPCRRASGKAAGRQWMVSL